MHEGGRKLGRILEHVTEHATCGISLLALERLADDLIRKEGGQASFKTVKGYKWATCLCVNEAVVHGIPVEYTLRDGDILTVDIGLLYQGLHTDTAWTIEVGHKEKHPNNPKSCREKQDFLAVGQKALWHAISQATAGNRIGHISKAIQDTIEQAGYNVVRTLVGHGVGKELHEEPQIPGILKGALESTPMLENGMTLAIEVIYAMGSGSIVYENDDGWTLSTRDRSISAVFEHTICISEDKPAILTRAEA